MAIALRSSNGYIEYNSGSSSTSHTIDISDAAVGDVRFMCCNWSPDGTGDLPSHPTITGWTAIGTSTATGAQSDSRLSLYYRVVQGGDTLTSATVGVTLDQTAYAIVNSFTLEGVDTGSVLDQTTPAMNTGSATTQPCPAITTTTDGAWVVHVAIQDGSSNMADGDEPGTDTLLGTQYGNPPSNGASIGCSYVVEASAGSSPSASWNTGVSEEYVGATFAVSPATGASVSPTDIDMDESSVTLTGTGFDASGNTVYLSDQNTTGSFYEVDVSSAIDTEGTTEITLDLTDLSSSELALLHELGPGTRYFIVDAAGGEVPSEEVALHRPEAFVMSLSSNFAPGSTTAQLTAPSGKTTGDMDGGRIEEAANPSATTTNVTTDDYREDEWCFAQKTLARKVAYEFRGTIAGAEYTTYTETPALNLTEESNGKVRVVPFSTTTGTGTLDITDTDFGTAKFALMFLSWADGLDAVDDAYRLSIGSTDGTDTRSVSVSADDNAISDNITYRYLNNSTYMGVIGNGTGTEQIRIEFDSWITDGIRVDVTLNSVSRACRGFVVLFGGSDFSFSFDAVSMNGTNTVNVTAPGFEPDALILSSQNNSTSLVTSHLTFGSAVNVGIADATSRMSPQAGIRHSSQDGTATTNIRTWIDHQDIGGRVPPAASGIRLSAVDFDSSGYSLAPGGDLSTDVQHVIAIGTAGKIPFAIAHFINPTSASVDWEVTDGSVMPQCVIGVMTAATNLDAANTDQDQHAKTFFAFDKDGNQACVGIAEDDAWSTSNTCVFASTNNAIWMRNDDQSGDFYLLGDPTIIPGGFRFPASEITTANATTRYGWALIIGDVITPAGTDVPANTDNLVLTEYPATIIYDYYVEANTDALNIATYQSIISLDVNIQTNVDTLILSEYNAQVGADYVIQAQTDELVLTENISIVSLDIDIAANTDTLSLSTYQSNVNLNVTLDTNVDPLVLATYSANIALDIDIDASSVALTLTEYQSAIEFNYFINANVDNLVLLEQQASVGAGTIIFADTDNLVLAEQTAEIIYDYYVFSNTDNLSITTYPAEIVFDTVISANTDSLILQTQQASVGAGNIVFANTDALALTENTSIVSLDIEIFADRAILSLTTYSATIGLGTTVFANTDILNITEYQSDINLNVFIDTNTDDLILNEFFATVNAETNILSDFVALILTEYSVTLTYDVNVFVNTDSLNITTYSATLIFDTNVLAKKTDLIISEHSALVFAGDNVNIPTNLTALSLVEYPSQIKADTSIFAGFDQLTITTNISQIGLGQSIEANVSTLILVENSVNISADTDVKANSDVLILDEKQSLISLDIDILVNTDDLTLSTYSAGIRLLTEVDGITDELILAPRKALISYDRDIACLTANLTMTIYDAEVAFVSVLNIYCFGPIEVQLEGDYIVTLEGEYEITLEGEDCVCV